MVPIFPHGAVLCERCLWMLGTDTQEASPWRAFAADKLGQGGNQVAAAAAPGLCLAFRVRGGCEDPAGAASRIAVCTLQSTCTPNLTRGL